MLPVVILVRPQMGENIGAVARAMSNFGLKELRIVAPRDGWPNAKATEMAAGAEGIITAAKIYENVASAMADITHAFATTARPRDMHKRVVDASAAAKEAVQHGASGATCALLFGPERAGLTNEDLTLCDTIVSIPTAPENTSLNIAQCSVIMFYEYWMAQGGSLPKIPASEIAPKAEWSGMFEQLEAYLDKADYFRVIEKKPVMWQNLQNMLLRGAWSDQELRTLRGMLRSIWERKRG